MHVMGAFIGVHGFQIRRMAHDLEAFRNAIATMHITAYAGNIQSFTTVVALHHADQLRACSAVIHHLPHAERRL